jgi:hypothetical protein
MDSGYRHAMKFTSHIILTAPLAGLTAWQAGLEPTAWLYAGALLIDVDHYIFYAMRTRRYNPVEMFSWYTESDKHCTPSSYYGLHIFHAAEIFLLLALVASFRPMVAWMLLGMGFHLILDYIWLYRHPVLSLTIRPLSWTEHLIRRLRGEREFWRDSPGAKPP